ncbi:MAG: carbohydrate porin [Candidatus Methylacidiphilales bacterium]|nr:carbohydrate porin [Candidatus Methylacidiphilales bacterium]
MINDHNWELGGGLVYTGLIPGRDADAAAIGVLNTNHSGSFQTANTDSNGQFHDGNEFVVEVCYVCQATPWWKVQPDIQYIVNPSGGIPRDQDGRFAGDALVVGIRSTLLF